VVASILMAIGLLSNASVRLLILCPAQCKRNCDFFFVLLPVFMDIVTGF